MIIARGPPPGPAAARRTGGEGGLVALVQAAQVQPQRVVADAADHRPRQAAPGGFQARQGPAGPLGFGGLDAQARAGQGVDRQRAAADLAEHGRQGHL
jgi:hypothetical protein